MTSDPPRPPAGRNAALPPGLRVAFDRETSLWSGGRVAIGGAPWKVVRLAAAARPHLAALKRAGNRGLVPEPGVGAALARLLLDHGLAHPRPEPRPGPHDVTVVVPAYGRVDDLDRTLTALRGLPVIVVDDASPDPEPVRKTALAHGATLERHMTNRGPAAARNTGLRLVDTTLVAFVDSDCRPEPGWLDGLVPYFDDPKVAVVAPRVVPEKSGRSLLGRYEASRSALDMGTRPALVKPGARLGFVPTATLLVRASAAADPAFAEQMRLGEDVDFVWRLADLGWHVRYQPEVRAVHTPRLKLREWARRRHEYGTSAPDLETRHPGRLAPARPSAWNLVTLWLLASGRPAAAAMSSAAATALLRRKFTTAPDSGWTISATIVGKGVAADAAMLGHALRREWWPLGLMCLAAAPRSRMARAASAAMLAPIALEWLKARPQVSTLSYTALRLADDLAYGSGVTAAAWRRRTLTALLPHVTLPGWKPLRKALRALTQ